MRRADNAKATPVGTGAGTAPDGRATSAEVTLRLPPRSTAPGDTALLTNGNLPRIGGRAEGGSPTPRLAELFGQDHKDSIRISPPPSTLNRVVQHQGNANSTVEPTRGSQIKSDAGVVIGIPLRTPQADSLLSDPLQLRHLLKAVATDTFFTSNAGNDKNAVRSSASTDSTPAREAIVVGPPSSPINTTNRFRPNTNSCTAHESAAVRVPTSASAHHACSTQNNPSNASSVTTLRNALRELRSGDRGAQATAEPRLKQILPEVAPLTSASNIFVKDAARAVLAILHDALHGVAVTPEAISDAGQRITKIERGAGTAPVVPSNAAPSLQSLLSHDARQPTEHDGMQRILQLGRESLTIVGSLQGFHGKHAPEHILSRVTQVMATTVARYIAALTHQIRSESVSVALHLTELSRALSAIASRPGRVDLRAFSLRLEGLLLVLTLHTQSPRAQGERRESYASARDLSQQISNHLLALSAYRTGKRALGSVDTHSELSADALTGFVDVNGSRGLLVEQLVTGASSKPDQASSAIWDADHLATILRATSL